MKSWEKKLHEIYYQNFLISWKDIKLLKSFILFLMEIYGQKHPQGLNHQSVVCSQVEQNVSIT